MILWIDNEKKPAYKNCIWARSIDEAIDWINQLGAYGTISTLNISIDMKNVSKLFMEMAKNKLFMGIDFHRSNL